MSDEIKTWRKASYSGASNACVEVGQSSGQLTVRDTKDREGAALEFPANAWRDFLAGIR